MKVKICGITEPEGLAAAIAAGAAYVGFVVFPPSPRSLAPEDAAPLAAAVPAGVTRVGLVVDPDDALLDRVARIPVDLIQLHGRESPARVAEVRARTGLPVMKAVGIAGAEDLPALASYEGVADRLLVDAKPPKGATRPGGNAAAFDWGLLAGRQWAGPWMLAGGLRPETLAEAVRVTGATELDVSSGVERAPGVKDPALVRAFIAAANAAPAGVERA